MTQVIFIPVSVDTQKRVVGMRIRRECLWTVIDAYQEWRFPSTETWFEEGFGTWEVGAVQEMANYACRVLELREGDRPQGD